ncbi:MAG: 4Fe-4S ferredoxin [Thermodesulfobacteriota bacterium]
MKVKRKIIEIDEALCNGCGQCVPDCAEGALQIVNGKAKLIAEKYCDGLGACLGGCPTGALRIIERVAEDFDEEAVEELLRQKEEKAEEAPAMACGCPSSRIQVFQPAPTPCQAANQPKSIVSHGEAASALTHWPVQIRLVPPTAPFLKNADLLVAADCTPLAYAHFHRDLLAGRVVMMGCPKFDETESYVQKFAEIFATAQIRSVTVAIMEVPCCANMRAIIRQAMELAGREIPVTEIVISARGEILRQGALAA